MLVIVGISTLDSFHLPPKQNRSAKRIPRLLQPFSADGGMQYMLHTRSEWFIEDQPGWMVMSIQSNLKVIRGCARTFTAVSIQPVKYSW